MRSGMIYQFIILVLLLTNFRINAREIYKCPGIIDDRLLDSGGVNVRTTITPNEFKGNNDIERIRAAIDFAKKTTNEVLIPRANINGTNVWLIDSAILLPSNLTLILENCVIQLSDSSRDNMFRSDNVGLNINDPDWNYNITIVGIGEVVLKGAGNPRATGDAGRLLKLDAKEGMGRISYGSDAERIGRKQKSDWRNNLFEIAYVKGFTLRNIKIENSHAWAIDFQRVWHGDISDIRIFNPQFITIDDKEVFTSNKDGINLRQGCKYFKISNITGINGDDLIALTNLESETSITTGDIRAFQVTAGTWKGPEDNIEEVFITNCKTNYTGVAIRASGEAEIHHVYIDGVMTRRHPEIPPPYGGSPYTLLVGNLAYGEKSLPGKIHNVVAMNLVGDGKTLIQIKSPIADCVFMNSVYIGVDAPEAVTYMINKSEVVNVKEINLIKQ